MSFDYVRQHYDVPANRGSRVVWIDNEGRERKGRITSATHRVHVRLDGETCVRRFHPLDLQYLSAPAPEGVDDE